MKQINTLLAVISFSVSVSGLLQQATLSFTSDSSSLQLAGNGVKSQIILDGKDWPGVIRTANDLAMDFGRVTGTNATIELVNNTVIQPMPLTSNGGATIIAGTIGNSSFIDNLISAQKINVSQIQGQWESFSSQVVSNPVPGLASALVIAGSDKRGTIYGMYDISEQMGVSPWYWFADVASKNQSAIYAMNMTKIQGPPSVKYRGLFINDEQPALTNWVNDNYPMGKYGPGFNHDFYSNVFELLLRLRANYLWPAEWNSMFNVDDPLNAPTADMYGIVQGTSHTEPLMRATKEQSLFLNGIWSWTENQANVTTFMEVGAERAAPYESVFTMGMRGLGDTASPTLNASELGQIIAVEQQLLQKAFNTSDITDIPQMWCLYKEVGGYFEQGLTVPDEITLLWADDNWGNNQRLPLSNETSRAGGAGVYYHFDYVGTPRDYKWINTIQLQKTWEQMHLAYERDAQTIWIVNVGDLKTLEVPINHFFDMAYNMPAMSSPDSTMTWLVQWAEREFGTAAANATANAMNTYGMLAGRRKFELVDPSTYSVNNYNEAQNVLAEWSDLVNQAQGIYNSLPAVSQPSFFELLLQPALSGYTLHQIHITAAMNNVYAEQRRTSANTLAQQALSAFNQDYAITQRYHTLLNGKWNHILDQTHLGYDYWQQPERNTLPPIAYVQTMETSLAGNMGVSVEASNGSVPGDSNYNVALSNDTLVLPPMDPYGPATRYIDIYSRGTGSFTYTVNTTGISWLTATPATGTLSAAANHTDQRVLLSIDWAAAPNGSNIVFIPITSSDDYGSYGAPQVNLPVNKTSIPASFHGFVESDATISMEAEHTSANTSTANASYAIIPGYGRTLSGVTLLPVTAASQTAPHGPMLQYSFYAFSNVSNANVTVYVGPSLNTIPTRPLKYALSIDDGPIATVQPCPTYMLGALPDAWNGAVANAAWANSSTVAVTPGSHTLKLWALEPALVFQKIVVNLGGVRASYLGPPESMRV
ncbi:hypothetical protein MMC27_006223 [Xylographa pallens]|nr:hypothetical protein [Xylographa pallens]